MRTTHGSPYDRGSADAWYGREYEPHYYVMDGPIAGMLPAHNRVPMLKMLITEIEEYQLGYESQTGRKQW